MTVLMTCGIDAACDCGTPYIPASQRAAEAIKANPGKSLRAVAEIAGVSHMAVKRAKAAVTVVPPDGARVTGKDGKSYPAKQVKNIDPTKVIDVSDDLKKNWERCLGALQTATREQQEAFAQRAVQVPAT
jgi:hypothetical protein